MFLLLLLAELSQEIGWGAGALKLEEESTIFLRYLGGVKAVLPQFKLHEPKKGDGTFFL